MTILTREEWERMKICNHEWHLNMPDMIICKKCNKILGKWIGIRASTISDNVSIYSKQTWDIELDSNLPEIQ